RIITRVRNASHDPSARHQRTERTSAVADEVLLIGIELTEAATELRNVEQRIVSESAASRGLVQDPAAAGADGHERSCHVADQCSGANVVRTTTFIREAREPLEQKRVVGVVESLAGEIVAARE